MRFTGLLVRAGVLGATLLLGCRATAPATAAPSARPAEPPARAPAPLDADRMFADLAHLASDDLRGRFSLSEDLDRAAGYLAAQLEAAAVPPVGADYLHPFPYVTGIAPGAEAMLQIRRKSRRASAAAGTRARFVPRPEGAPGRARGPVVFVGYGVASTPEQDGPPAYDDLAGLDLEGKIALLFLHAPRTPSLPSLFAALEEVAADFDAAAPALRKEDDRAGLAALHRRAREAIARIVTPYVGEDALPEGFTDPPDDPTAGLEMMAILAPILRAWRDRGGPEFDRSAMALSAKLERLADRGAVGAIVVEGPRSLVTPEAREADALPDPGELRPPETPAPIPAIQIGWKEADRLFRIGRRRPSAVQARIDERLAPASRALPYEAEIVSTFSPKARDLPNVLAYVPGRERPEEIVVVGAHYDHIGTAEQGMCRPVERDDGSKDTICNGADDNASGTAMVLELARSYARARPARSVVFAFFAGEELGLHGSRALADDPPKAPPFDGGRVVAMINLDMVGRLHAAGLAIGGVGTSPAWMPLLDRIGNGGMKVLYERAVTSRSDQANFYRHRIPVLFFFTGVHRDYHRATDEADRIARDDMARIGELVAKTLWAVADGLPVPYAPPKTPDEGLVPGLPGSNPATVEKRVRSDGTVYGSD